MDGHVDTDLLELELKLIKPDKLETTKECDVILDRLSTATASMEQQIYESKARHATTGESTDYEWFGRVNFALKRHKAMRQAVNMRRAELARVEKRERHAKLDKDRERLFIDKCRQTIDQATYLRIWQMVDEVLPPEP